MKKNLILLLCSLQFLFSCKKSDTTVSFQGRTYAFLRVEDGKASGYIKGRELTQQELIDYISDANFYFDPISNKSPLQDTISFIDDKRVSYNKGGIKSWFYKVKGNTIRYTSDTLLGNYCNRPYTCLIDAFLWKPDSVGVLKNYASIPGGAPPLMKSIGYKENKLDGDDIIVPVLCFKIRHYTSGVSGVAENYFDKKYIDLLNENDTIAVKEYKMIFKKTN